MKDLATFIYQELVISFRALELDNGDCNVFLMMTFTVRKIAQIFAKCQKTQSTTVAQQLVYHTLQNYSS